MSVIHFRIFKSNPTFVPVSAYPLAQPSSATFRSAVSLSKKSAIDG